jgi:hypothetical protein
MSSSLIPPKKPPKKPNRHSIVEAQTVFNSEIKEPLIRDKVDSTITLSVELSSNLIIDNNNNNNNNNKDLNEELKYVCQNWVADEDVDKCFSCNLNFDFINRKHHCRCCVQIFCESCSSSKKILPKVFGDEENIPQRVCSKCYEKIDILTSTEIIKEYKLLLIIKQGLLRKVNRDGKETLYEFTLTSDALSYKEPIDLKEAKISNNLKSNEIRSIKTELLLVQPNKSDVESFIILSKYKSFIINCSSKEEVDHWCLVINEAIKHKQQGDSLIVENDCSPIFLPKTSECQNCSLHFGFFDTKHHCRNW